MASILSRPQCVKHAIHRDPPSVRRDSTVAIIDQAHKSHNAPDEYPTMQHFVTEMCTYVHISVTKCCIVGYPSNA